MTLYELVADAGIVLSFCLFLALAELFPARRSRARLCFKARTDTECLPDCLRTCPLMAAHITVMMAPAWAL